MKKTVYFLFLIILTNCSVAQNHETNFRTKKYRSYMKNFILGEIDSRSKIGLKIEDEIISKPTYDLNISLIDLFDDNHFYLINPIKPDSKKRMLSFDKMFNANEYKSMKLQIMQSELKTWSQLIGNKNLIPKDQSIQPKLKYSIPVFNKDFSFAIVYIESLNSGELRAYKRVKNKWIIYGVVGIWSAD